MFVNESLNQTISLRGQRRRFQPITKLAGTWDFILELVKICDDSDEGTPSIRHLKEALADTETLRILKEEYHSSILGTAQRAG